MPKKSKKAELIDAVIVNFLERSANAINYDEEEELWDECLQDLLQIVVYRYGVNFVHGSVIKSRRWRCEVVPNIDDDRFRHLFRVDRYHFHVILNEIRDDPLFHSKLQFPVDVQLMMVLYRLGCSGEGATVGKIATLFGIGDGGTVENVTNRVFRAILNVKDKFLYWPNQEERSFIVGETHDELPYCVGYIDGTEIALAEKPVLHPDDYYSRKQRFSVKGQIVCDYKCRVRSIVVGYPGSVHDARIFSLSELGKNPHLFLSDSEWLAGDSAYKLTATMITPFKGNAGSPVSERQIRFNKRFSRYRVRVEHTFGQMKERFNSLKEMKIRIVNSANLKFLCDWLTVCAVLHNIIKTTTTDEAPSDVEIHDVHEIEDDAVLNLSDVDDVAGVLKRNALVELLT